LGGAGHTTIITPPSVTTNTASGITTTTATLNGNLTALGTATTVQVSFEWGLTTSYGNTTTPQPKTSTGSFNSSLTNLTSNTTYHFRAKAVGDGTAYGSDQQFSTNATFGLNDGNNTSSQAANILNAMRFQNTVRTGTLIKLEILFNDSTPTGKVRLGVYTDNNGTPGNLYWMPARSMCQWLGIYQRLKSNG